MSLLSLCLPVRNGQTILEALVDDSLEILHELVPRAELIIFDNGSTDTTPEIAHELAMRYPQVRHISFPLPISRELMWRAALAEAHGDTLLFRDVDCRLNIHDMQKLWVELAHRDAVLGRVQTERPGGWVSVIQRLGQVAGKVGGETNERLDMVLIRRRAFDAARAACAGRGSLADELTRFGHPWINVNLRGRGLGQIPPLPSKIGQGQAAQTASSDPAGARVRRPNYLAGLKDFAIGE